MKLIIAGGRDCTDEKVLFRTLAKFPDLRADEVVCGMAKGADTLGYNYATCLGLDIKEFPAQWDLNGRKAGPLRNIEMGDYADALLALWDGESKGTKHMIEYMRKLNKPVYIYNY